MTVLSRILSISCMLFSLFLTTQVHAINEVSPASSTESLALENDFEKNLSGLLSKSYKEKEIVIRKLAKNSDERVLKLFSEMQKGKLHFTKKEKQIVYISEVESGYKITSVINNDDLGIVSKRSLKKIKVNNKLRKVLRGEIAKLSLNNEDVNVRRTAVLEIMGSLNQENIALLKLAAQNEKDESIKEIIVVAVAIDNMQTGDKSSKLKSIAILKDSLITEGRIALERFIEKEKSEEYVEKDKQLIVAAESALKTINSRLEVNAFAETIFFGLSLGSVLLLSAIGLAITFGVMGVINMAHGEMMMLGAYTTYLIQLALPEYIEYSLAFAIPAAFMVSGLFGIAIERGVIRFLYGRPLETLLATFGVSLILQQLVRTTISAQNVAVSTPEWLSGSLQINPALSITYNRLYIIVFSLLVFFALLYILKKTILGLQVRAVSQNRAMAKAMGVRSDWVDALTFGLGSGIAGIAGVALSQLTNVGPNLGQSYIIDSFMVVVFGGVGNLWGTLVGAMSLGIVNKFLEPWSGAVLAKIFVLVFIILFIQKKPRGLFPKKGRGAEG